MKRKQVAKRAMAAFTAGMCAFAALSLTEIPAEAAGMLPAEASSGRETLTAGKLPEKTATAGETFVNPNNNRSYQWTAREDGALVLYKDGALDSDEFVSDGAYTYYCQADGTVMKDQLTYHPDGQHIIYFDAEGHEVFNAFTHISKSISGEAVDDQCYFNANGFMYVNTVTYDVTGTKLYYINPYGRMEHTGWFSFDPNAGYGDTGKWTFTGDSYRGFANYDGTLITNQASFDGNGNPIYFQGNGEYKSLQPAGPITPTTSEIDTMAAVGNAYLYNRESWYWKQYCQVRNNRIPAEALRTDMYSTVWLGLVSYNAYTDSLVPDVSGISIGTASDGYGQIATATGDTMNAIADMLYAQNVNYQGVSYDLVTAYSSGDLNDYEGYDAASNVFYLGSAGDPGEDYPFVKQKSVNADGTVTISYGEEDYETGATKDVGYVIFAPLSDGNPLFRYGLVNVVFY